MANEFSKLMGDKEQYKKGWQFAAVFIGFGLLSLITALIQNVSMETLLDEKFSLEENPVLGPIKIDKDNTIVSITLRHVTQNQSWRYVGVNLLDKNKQFLMGFGDEFWHESGYDEGPWTETKYNYDNKITIPKKGDYYLNFDTEGTSYLEPVSSTVQITVDKKLSGFLPHLWLGVLCIIAAVVSWFIGAHRSGQLSQMLNETE